MNLTAHYTRRLLTGDFSQGQAFWGILVPALMLLKFAIAMLSLMNIIDSPVVSTRLWLPVVAIIVLVVIPILFYTCARAIHISAIKFRGGHHSILLSLATLYAFYLVLTQVIHYWPALNTMVDIATKQSQTDLVIEYQANAGTLLLSGGLDYDSSKALNRALKTHPEVKTVQLNLNGGQLHEARAVASVIIKHKLNTEVVDTCSASCMLVLVAGKDRIAHEGATLRFHRTLDYDNGYRNEFVMERERRADRHFYQLRGVAESYLHPIYYKQRNNDYLEPGLEVLYSYGVINKIVES